MFHNSDSTFTAQTIQQRLIEIPERPKTTIYYYSNKPFIGHWTIATRRKVRPFIDSIGQVRWFLRAPLLVCILRIDAVFMFGSRDLLHSHHGFSMLLF